MGATSGQLGVGTHISTSERTRDHQFMEPRPQRPRAQSGQPTQPARSTQPLAPGEYPEGADPTAFIAPARTEYDYSPLDLAPPGQRRRRQLVAAAVGALSVVMLGAIIFFSYLLLRDEEAPSQNDDLLAAQTQVANDAATVSANQTVVARAAADQTAEAQTLNPDATTEPAGEGTGSEETPPATDETPAAGEPSATGAETPASDEPDNAPDLSGDASLTEAQLIELLPASEQLPIALTNGDDLTRTQEEVVAALGGGRLAETNLTDWGWTGNVERPFSAPDETNADPASTTNLTVSVHGFGDPTAAAEALPFFSDILVNTAGYVELAAPQLGDSIRVLTTTNELGATLVALYVQDGSVMYRIGGFSPSGDPAQDVIDVATTLLGD